MDQQQQQQQQPINANNQLVLKPRKPIRFYTSSTTPACRAVKMVATHLQIPLDEIKLRCYIDTRTEKFRKINPCHTLPVIDDDGYILWESRAIMQYLCNEYAPESNLYPSDPQKRATVDRLLDFDLKSLSQSVMAVHFEFMFPSEYSTSRGEKLIAVTNALTLLEIFLINKNYVACNHLTIADISILANVSLLEIAVEFDLSSYPNIWLWINRLRHELPYYEPLTKMAHDELRTLIQNVRDAHDEWSSPLPKCAFTPNGNNHSSCIEEQRRQYKRLFSNDSAQRDAARIMAAVIPVFRTTHENNVNNNGHLIDNNNHNHNNFRNFSNQKFESRSAPLNSSIEFFSDYDFNSINRNNTNNNNIDQDDNLTITIENNSKRIRRSSYHSDQSLPLNYNNLIDNNKNDFTENHLNCCNINCNKKINPYIKRIRLTIEPNNTGPPQSSFQFNPIESSIIQ